MWIVGGDINAILHINEKMGGLDADTRIQDFQECLLQTGLSDL